MKIKFDVKLPKKIKKKITRRLDVLQAAVLTLINQGNDMNDKLVALQAQVEKTNTVMAQAVALLVTQKDTLAALSQQIKDAAGDMEALALITAALDAGDDSLEAFLAANEETPVDPVDPVEEETPVDPIEEETPVDPIEEETPVDPIEEETPVDPIEEETPVDPVEEEGTPADQYDPIPEDPTV